MIKNIIKFVGFLSLLTISCNNIDNVNTINFSGLTLEEETFNLEDYKGIPVIINFWYPSCPPCVKEIPNLVELLNKNPNKIKIIGVLHNSPFDSKDSAKQLLDNLNAEYVNIFDQEGKIEHQFSIQVHPTSIFLNDEHQINNQWSGYLDKKKLEELIKEIIIQ